MKVYLVDSSNNNKVVGQFQSKKEGKEYIKSIFARSNVNGSFKEFLSDYFFISTKDMEEKAKKYGSRIKQYYN